MPFLPPDTTQHSAFISFFLTGADERSQIDVERHAFEQHAGIHTAVNGQ